MGSAGLDLACPSSTGPLHSVRYSIRDVTPSCSQVFGLPRLPRVIRESNRILGDVFVNSWPTTGLSNNEDDAGWNLPAMHALGNFEDLWDDTFQGMLWVRLDNR